MIHTIFFYHVAKFGNLSRAASALYLSQSTVSRAVQSLEAELSCKLFERNPHGVSLTSEGVLLFDYIAQAHDLVENGEKHLKEARHLHAECLRIGVTEFTFCQYILPVLPSLCHDYPDIHLEFCSQKALADDPVFSRLTGGKLDLLFTISPIFVSSDLKVTHLTDYSDIIIAGKQFSELQNVTVDLPALQKYPWVSYYDFGQTDSFLDRSMNLFGTTLFPRFLVDSGTYFNSFVLRGLSLALIPEPLFRSFAHETGLFRVSPSVPLPTRSVCVVTSNNHTLSPAGACLIRLVQQNIQAQLNTEQQIISENH